MRHRNSKLAPVLRAMDAFTAPASAEPTPRRTGECSYGLHQHYQHHVRYDGATGWVEWLPCECACHGEKPAKPAPEPAQPVSVPEPDEYGYWTRRPDGGLHYHAYDPATEDDELADHLIDSGDMPDDAPVTCHRCGAVVDGDALTVQTAADGTPKLDVFLCRAHLVAGTERLKAAIRAQREGGE